MRALLVLLMMPIFSHACLCFREPHRQRLDGEAVFTAKVVSSMVGPTDNFDLIARLQIEEDFGGLKEASSEIALHTDALDWCREDLQEGQRYLFVAHYSDDSMQLWESNCSPPLAVSGNQAFVDALRNQRDGGASRILGRLKTEALTGGTEEHPIAGALVTADSDNAHYEILSDVEGRYEIRGVRPGLYRIAAGKAGYVRSEWPDFDFGGSAQIEPNGFAVANLHLTTDTSIAGIVRDKAGHSLEGVQVGAYGIFGGGVVGNHVGSATTDAEGKYRIGPLAEGLFAIKVNGGEWPGESPRKPASYPSPVRLDAFENKTGIDLVLEPPRTPARLTIVLRRPDGGPEAKALVFLSNQCRRIPNQCRNRQRGSRNPDRLGPRAVSG
jgi:hypothetical protein